MKSLSDAFSGCWWSLDFDDVSLVSTCWLLFSFCSSSFFHRGEGSVTTDVGDSDAMLACD